MSTLKTTSIKMRAEKLKKIDELVAAGAYSSRSEFFRRAAGRELDIVRRRIARAQTGRKRRGKKRVTWRDLDDAALDAIAEILKRAKKRRQ